MTSTTVLRTAAAFAELDARLRLTPEQRGVVEARRASTEELLLRFFGPTSTLPLVGTTVIGSADRDTMIQPLDEVDVLASFSAANGAWERYRGNSREFTGVLRRALAGVEVHVVDGQGQALRLVCSTTPDVHLVPVFGYRDGGYALPTGAGGWLPTNPDRHASWLAAAGPHVPPTVRALKHWNRLHGSRLRAFHVEVLVGTTVGGTDVEGGQALHRVFQVCQARLDVADPSGLGGDLSTYLTDEDRAVLGPSFRFARAHAGLALEAEAAGDHEEAISLWRIVLGPDFPAYG